MQGFSRAVFQREREFAECKFFAKAKEERKATGEKELNIRYGKNMIERENMGIITVKKFSEVLK